MTAIEVETESSVLSSNNGLRHVIGWPGFFTLVLSIKSPTVIRPGVLPPITVAGRPSYAHPRILAVDALFNQGQVPRINGGGAFEFDAATGRRTPPSRSPC
jgi:hypothetical protein